MLNRTEKLKRAKAYEILKGSKFARYEFTLDHLDGDKDVLYMFDSRIRDIEVKLQTLYPEKDDEVFEQAVIKQGHNIDGNYGSNTVKIIYNDNYNKEFNILCDPTFDVYKMNDNANLYKVSQDELGRISKETEEKFKGDTFYRQVNFEVQSDTTSIAKGQKVERTINSVYSDSAFLVKEHTTYNVVVVYPSLYNIPPIVLISELDILDNAIIPAVFGDVEGIGSTYSSQVESQTRQYSEKVKSTFADLDTLVKESQIENMFETFPNISCEAIDDDKYYVKYHGKNIAIVDKTKAPFYAEAIEVIIGNEDNKYVLEDLFEHHDSKLFDVAYEYSSDTSDPLRYSLHTDQLKLFGNTSKPREEYIAFSVCKENHISIEVKCNNITLYTDFDKFMHTFKKVHTGTNPIDIKYTYVALNSESGKVELNDEIYDEEDKAMITDWLLNTDPFGIDIRTI